MKIKERTKNYIQLILQFSIMLAMLILLKLYDITTVSPEHSLIAMYIILPAGVLIMSVWIVGDLVS